MNRLMELTSRLTGFKSSNYYLLRGLGWTPSRTLGRTGLDWVGLWLDSGLDSGLDSAWD